jgi:hypothetical protein
MDDDHAEDKDEFNPLIAMMKHLQEIGARHKKLNQTRFL